VLSSSFLISSGSNDTLLLASSTIPFAFDFNLSIDLVNSVLKPSLSYCLLGSSGVGKTTLLNSVIGSTEFATQSVSKIQSKGRHTTTSRQLVRLQNGAMIIDTPGMRELGSVSEGEGLDDTFSEILVLSQSCKFNNCSHTNEKGCAILAAINKGTLSEQRYQNYQNMKKESDFNQMSYLEKKNKDKNLGKLIKATLKNNKR
jgi:ribosome biogenesis GTPase